jgi:hypothetical protein
MWHKSVGTDRGLAKAGHAEANCTSHFLEAERGAVTIAETGVLLRPALACCTPRAARTFSALSLSRNAR